MEAKIKDIIDLESLIKYFIRELGWAIDEDYFYEIEDITYDFEPEDIGLKREEFSKIKSLRQLRPIIEQQPWGIFSVEFDSNSFEITALRKILSGLIPKQRRNSEHAVWEKNNLLFLCFWGEGYHRTIGIAHFEDKENQLPQIKMISCSPSKEDFTQLQNFENKLQKLKWPNNTYNILEWKESWSSAFTIQYKEVIKSSQILTQHLAQLALDIRDRILNIMRVETSNGYVHLLYKKFKDSLIQEMTQTQFADMYAQTIVYGLFSACCIEGMDLEFDPIKAIDCMPNTNPFLKNLMKECFSQQNNKLSFDELELNDIVMLLNNTDTTRIIDDFNRQTGDGKEDPVIYFYEGFLNQYEKQQKKRRGVYYTPQPVVNFMVKAVDEILKNYFLIDDGLCSTKTKKVKYFRDSKRKQSGLITKVADEKEVPLVQILDPATGTGTFLREVILKIYEEFKAKNSHKSTKEIQELWNQYVPSHLLTRINGFELMMAPYAVAHMKLSMLLKDTGYNFNSEERLKVFLTNSLEEAGEVSSMQSLWDDFLARESVGANRVKTDEGINIVIGNPPYSGESSNNGEWITSLIEDYKLEPGTNQKLRERNPKWINNDYVKFIRYAQEFVSRAGSGIISYINPHGFLDDPTFRGMRWNLLNNFDEIYIIDLHGNAKKNEICPDGSKDENVFDIQQGVCILFLIKLTSKKKNTIATVYHKDIFGLRQEKYTLLSNLKMNDIEWNVLKPESPNYFMVPKDFSFKKSYDRGIPLTGLFNKNSVGIVSAKDRVLINYTTEELLQNVSTCYKEVASIDYVKTIAYRPFDSRYIYYDTTKVERSRENIMSQFTNMNNIGLAINKVFKTGDTYQHCFLTNQMMDSCYVSNRTSEITYVFPIYSIENNVVKSNIVEGGALRLLEKCTDKYLGESIYEEEGITAINVFDYVYAILHSNKYRAMYKEFLKIDFPMIPIAKNNDYFWEIANLGEQLRLTHLMENVDLSNQNVEFISTGNKVVEKLKYVNERVYINSHSCFDNVPFHCWEFKIGAYCPLQKWLKDRKNRILSDLEILYYKKIVVAISKTLSIIEDIDKVISL